jgi:hypothetical protein
LERSCENPKNQDLRTNGKCRSVETSATTAYIAVLLDNEEFDLPWPSLSILSKSMRIMRNCTDIASKDRALYGFIDTPY